MSLLTLVNVHTAPAVSGEFVALPAVASVRAPEVRAVVTADIGYFYALINISASLAGWLEALFADTSVGSCVVILQAGWFNQSEALPGKF